MSVMPRRPDAGRTLDPRVASVLAYSGWWVTGALFLAVEHVDAQVRFHAAQSVVVFGLVSLVVGVAYLTALPLMLWSADAARLALAAANVTWLAGAALWAWLVYAAARGERWSVPGLSGAIARLAAAPR